MVEFDELCRTVGELVSLSTELDSNPKREKKGGIFRYMPENRILTGSSNPYIETIGEVQTDKLNLYGAISGEKAARLYSDWLRAFKEGDPLKVFSSWQTRDFDNSKYGGAILINHSNASVPANQRSCDILSFSGLVEPLDEAVMVITGLEHDLLSSTQAGQIIRFSANSTYKELYGKFYSRS